MTLAKRILIGLVALLALLLVAAVVIVATVDLNRFKPTIERTAEQQLGRQLTIAGDIGWSLWPTLGVALADAQLSNAPGFGEEPMVAIERLSLGVAVLPLLSGELRVSEVVLERPAIALAVAADGRSNWDDIVERLTQEQPAPEPSPDTGGDAAQLELVIEGVRISDATLSWDDATTGQQLQVAPFNLRTGAYAADSWMPIEATLQVTGTEPALTAALALDAELRTNADFSRFELRELQLELDESTLTGALRAELGDITELNFELALDTIDLDRYLPDEEAAPGTPAPVGQSPAATGGTAPAAEDPWSWMDGLAANGTLQAGHVSVAGLTLEQLNATLTLRNRVLVLDPLTARLYGGEQQLALRFDASQPQPATHLQASLQSVSIGELLGAWMESAPLRGTAALEADLRLTGLEPEQIKRSLTGSGELRISDGALQGINVAQELRNAIALLRGQPRTNAVAETDFTELVLPFTANQGLVEWPSLSAQSPLLRLSSAGRLNLATDELRADLDAAVVKTLEGQGGEPLSELAGFTIPIQLRGTLEEPAVKLDLKSVLAQTRLGEKKEELETKLDERKEELRGKAEEELQRGLERLLR